MKIDFQDRIDDYLLDRMSDEERKSFESDAAEDAELKEQLQFTETVQQATKSRNEKLAAMEEWKDDYVWEDERVAAASAAEYRPTGSGYNYCPAPTMKESRSMPRSSGRRIFYWISGIAAVFVVGFFLIQNLYVANSPVEYMPSPRMNDMTIRAGSDNSEIELLLSQKKYEDALPWAEKATAAYPDNPGIIDTLATVYQGLGRYNEAMEQFELCLKLYKENEKSEEGIRSTEEKINKLKALMEQRK